MYVHNRVIARFNEHMDKHVEAHGPYPDEVFMSTYVGDIPNNWEELIDRKIKEAEAKAEELKGEGQK